MWQVEYVIRPPGRFTPVSWRELWAYRDLFAAYVRRDISVRYKQTVLGALWAVLQPVVTMVVFTLVFNRIGGLKSGDRTPYPIFLYTGLLIWQYYSNTLSGAAGSMVANAGLVQKVYFPRLIIPAAAAITPLVDLAIASSVLAAMMVYHGYRPQPVGLLILPVLVLATVLAALGAGLIFAALNVKYRDVKHALPFVIQTTMFLTPVVYPVAMLDGHPTARALVSWLNPLSGIITNARAGLLGQGPIDWKALGVSLATSAALAVVGLFYFRCAERDFADVV